MRELIREQLRKVQFADLSDYDAATNTYRIPKYSKPVYGVGKMYVVRLQKSLVGNCDSVLATNWNHGTAPSGECLKIYVSKALGKMLYVDSIVFDEEAGRDTSMLWSGWLPIDDMTQILAL